MGENKHIDELDAFAKKYIKEEIANNAPSKNFTANIMEVILTEKPQQVYKHNLNLSMSIWFVLGGFIIASISLLFFGKKTTIALPEFNITLPEFNFSKILELNLEVVKVSETTVYAFFFLMLLFFVQVYFIKNYYNKQFE